MKVEVKVEVMENNGVKVPIGEDKEYLTINSHWNFNGPLGWVVLQLPGSDKTITVYAPSLQKAIEACTGLRR